MIRAAAQDDVPASELPAEVLAVRDCGLRGMPPVGHPRGLSPWLRSFVVLLVGAHVWVGAMPCAPGNRSARTGRARLPAVSTSGPFATAPAPRRTEAGRPDPHAGHAMHGHDVRAAHPHHADTTRGAGSQQAMLTDDASHSQHAVHAEHASHSQHVMHAEQTHPSQEAGPARHSHHPGHAAHASPSPDAGRSRAAVDGVEVEPGAAVASRAPTRFLTAVCPCGCDKRAPTAGASSVRIGVALPPWAQLERPVATRVTAPQCPAPVELDVTLAGPDPVPRTVSIA